jgi:hypothetical protein
MKNLQILRLKLYTIIAFTLSFILGSCAGPKVDEAPQKSALTFGMIKTKIIEGRTAQSEILQTFGSPNIVTKNKEGEEVWTYSKQSSDSSSGGYYGTLILAGGHKESSSRSMNTLDLFITFDKSDIVKKYSVVQSQF